MENLRQLHIIRGIAALYVAIGHAKMIFWCGGKAYLEKFPKTSWHWNDYLLFGSDLMSSAGIEQVIVFFVLSGFFIHHSFEKNQWSIKDFFINRILRIYPPYLLALAMSALISIVLHIYFSSIFTANEISFVMQRCHNSFQELDLTSLLWSLFYFPNQDYIAGNFAFWSLIQEWFFYLIIPFCLIWRKEVTGILFFLFLTAHVIGFEREPNTLFLFIFDYGIYFFVGVLFYDFYKTQKWLKIVPSPVISFVILLILFLSGILTGIVGLEPLSYCISAIYTLFAILVFSKYTIKNVFLRSAGLFLGDISFSLYIFHLPFYYICYAFLTKYTAQFIFYDRIYWFFIPLVIIFSYLMYLLLEKRTLIWIKNLKDKSLNL